MNAISREVTLDDKYVLERGPVFMTGIQALVRLPLEQIRRDRTAGLDTAGYISGYRGSPLAGYDQQLERAQRFLDSHNLVFQPGLNEEMAATAVWGSQKTGLSGESDYDGVFGIWYGKAPGVDRAGDVLRHANASGTAAAGGVLAIAGDDHLAKSSSLPVQSEHAFIHAEIPVLNPSDLQDVLDYGLHGIAMSRYSGLWVALIALADTMDSSGVVDVDPTRLSIRRPPGKENPARWPGQCVLSTAGASRSAISGRALPPVERYRPNIRAARAIIAAVMSLPIIDRTKASCCCFSLRRVWPFNFSRSTVATTPSAWANSVERISRICSSCLLIRPTRPGLSPLPRNSSSISVLPASSRSNLSLHTF